MRELLEGLRERRHGGHGNGNDDDDRADAGRP